MSLIKQRQKLVKNNKNPAVPYLMNILKFLS